MEMNSGRLLSRHPLSNGLTLEFWDHSRPVAGGRWFVLLETRITIPVKPETLPPELKPVANQVVQTLGSEIIFTQKEERNFIAASEFPVLMKDMQDRILDLSPRYFGHEDFAPKFIRKTYTACRERQHSQGERT